MVQILNNAFVNLMIQQENRIKPYEHLDSDVQATMEVLDYEKFSSNFNGDYSLPI